MPSLFGRLSHPTYGTVGAVVLGLSLRILHYLKNPSVWHDEAALIVNVLAKDFGDLLGPLLLSEAAPPLFLWLERAVSLLLGDSTYALRLVPLLSSCLALPLFVWVARRWLPVASVPWATLLFACSDRLLWHACEAKPYAVDVLMATTVLALFTGTRSWPLGWQLLIYTLLAPVLIFLTFPGCFLCGGLLVTLLPAVWRARRRRLWVGYGLWAGVVGGAFFLLLAGPVRAQRCPPMDQCWTALFPDLTRPWFLPVWFGRSTLGVAGYCCRPGGEFLIGLAVVGGLRLWRQGGRALLLLLTAPAALALVAAFLHGYPYGGARVIIYTGPAFLLLTASGLPETVAWLGRRGRWGPAALFALLALPLANALYRVAVPWPRCDAAGASAYVLAHRRPGESVLANGWEYLYYFRHQGNQFGLLDDPNVVPSERLWVVVTAREAEARQRFAAAFANSWSTLERREFALTTVFYLGPLSRDAFPHQGQTSLTGTPCSP